MIHVKHRVLFETIEKACYIRIFGEIDHHSAIEVRVRVDETLLKERPKIVFLDLSSVDFMDSSGLGLIMGRLATVTRYGGQFAVLDPSPAAKRMIRLAALDRVIKIHNCKQERGT